MLPLLPSLLAFANLTRHFLCATFLLVFVTGCSTTPEVSAEDAYQPPATTAGMATLRGSAINEEGLFGSEHRGFVSMIDYKMVPDAAEQWNEPIVLHPGKRNVTAEYRYSNFMTRAYVSFEAKPDAHYQLMIKNGREPGMDVRLFNDFWIVDLATGKPVTPVFHRQVSGGKKGTVFYQNK